ncbi:hypothetical protein QVD17_05551 [Tagetes erecta]|uniref:Disease resistance R13L4/SHOC-2-like LRR domain-containing protein n=1 Tax=Tagetes erecta TaxID=13708 RepID=A0AAD8LIG7_TARER|nr:hypothetical protein QVD17_05551 [Tagetes erecta]
MAFSFMQTILFIYFLVISTCVASLVSHEEECLALFEFKQSNPHQPHASFNVGGFQKLDSWRKNRGNVSDHDFDCCLWDGVVCSDDHHVIGLDLSHSSLHGSIKSNSSLFNLVHLQMLNLSMNNFVGSQIPPEISRLRKLRSLDLSNSNFIGQIPIEISHLMQLTSLDLSGNPLKLHSPSIEYLLQNLTRLQELHLSGVDISSTIPPFLGNFSSLRSIGLDGCWLRGKFPSTIFHLPKLKLLSLETNPSLIGSLPEFQNDTLLEHLDLYATSFFGSIPESIGKLKHLVSLTLHGSYLSGCIPHSLSNMTQLKVLNLGQEEFMGLAPSFPRLLPTPVGLEICDQKGHMGEWIRKLTNLEVLYLVGMQIYGEVLPSLANLTKLSVVIMRKNLIYGHVPSSFMNHTQIRMIDLRGNHLQGQISSSFSSFTSLEFLGLSGNNFSGRLDVDIFLGLTRLEALFLGGRNRISCIVSTNNYTNSTLLPELKHLELSSCNLREFPYLLRFQNKIEILSLQNNEIKGLVPDWILNNSQETLQCLDLSYNSISGFHGHPKFLPWVRLQLFNIEHNQLPGQLPIPPLTTVIYDVSNNNLFGEIPPMICEVKSLRVLDLSSNNMTGTLPHCLGNLSSLLLVLDLKRNNFHGPMMYTFTHGSLMKRIDLSENQFTGQLSKTLANCTNLEFLSLDGNSFEDVFPFWLGSLPNLQILILRSNKFFGAIQGLTTPGSVFQKLRIMDLSNNDFSGQLPKNIFQTWNAMKSIDVEKSSMMETKLYVEPRSTFDFPYSMTLTNKGVKIEYPHILNILIAIDLSSNNFKGHIPESLNDLHGLQSVNLSNNHFTGCVLPSLGNLRNLESLDLSQNELAGEIPHELLQLNFLSILNVSFNHLHGSIPQGKQFNTFDNNSYMGNLGLCGKPLSQECQASTTPTTLVPSTNNEYESLLPCEIIDWIIIFLGVGSGLVVGVVLRNLLSARYNDWFIESLGMREDKWIRPLRLNVVGVKPLG